MDELLSAELQTITDQKVIISIKKRNVDFCVIKTPYMADVEGIPICWFANLFVPLRHETTTCLFALLLVPYRCR